MCNILGEVMDDKSSPKDKIQIYVAGLLKVSDDPRPKVVYWHRFTCVPDPRCGAIIIKHDDCFSFARLTLDEDDGSQNIQMTAGHACYTIQDAINRSWKWIYLYDLIENVEE
jgi:hypothetical protein